MLDTSTLPVCTSNNVHGLRDAGPTDDGRWYHFRKGSERSSTTSYSSGTGFRLPRAFPGVLPIQVLYRTGQI